MPHLSETSVLYEQVAADLLSETNQYTINIVDGVEKSLRGQIHSEVEVKNPFAWDPKAFLPNAIVMDLPRFYEIAGDVIANAQEREGTLQKERITLVQEYPPEKFELFGDEVITARVLSRHPAKMSADGKSRPQRASRHEYEVRMPQHPNKIITVESRPIDHDIEFTCWARTSTLANKRALWLEKLFITHAWAFQAQGVDRFLWDGRGPDELWKHEEQRLHRRPLRFMVRLFEFEVYANPVIKKIDFKVSI